MAKKGTIKRFGVSLDENLLNELDGLVANHKFPNRSQAIRYLVQKNMVEEKWSDDEMVAGAIVLVYDHHKRELQKKSTHVQHDFHHLILSVQHVHLDHDHCLETIAVKGKARELQLLADNLIGLKGITHGRLVMTVSH
ncbi:MAG: nickel-responsive transcriptional regulator NikR [Bacteroidetes bacterium]|nr:nickel-responsive transcriptional regulator NikR [Bacteroidota bacterium]MBU1720163.1 nickel-responsive transcriptional regulator NikR [Bacteroidota bacterium]